MKFVKDRITLDQFNNLVERIKGIKNMTQFHYGRYIATFEYVNMKESGTFYQFYRLDPKAITDDVREIGFTVVGFEKDYITDVIFTRNNLGLAYVYYTPVRKKILVDEFLYIFLKDY